MSKVLQGIVDPSSSIYKIEGISPQNSLTKIISSHSLGASNITTLSQQHQVFFKQHWQKVSQSKYLEVEKFKQNQKKYHIDKDKVAQNLEESLKSESDTGICYYLIQQIWIPYIHQKFILFSLINRSGWITEFISDLEEMNEAVLDILDNYYPKNETTLQTFKERVFKLIVRYTTSHKKWQKINEIIIDIVSRIKNKLKIHKWTTPQLLGLSKSNSQFEKEVNLLKDIYLQPSITTKLQKIVEFSRLVYSKFSSKQIGRSLEYCMLMTGYDGFSELFQFILAISKPVIDSQQKLFLQSLIVVTNNLLSRDATGFTNQKMSSKINQNVVSKAAWRFLYNRMNSFMFYNQIKVSHEQSSWQSLMSWNYLKSDCEVSMGFDVKHNFVKFGIIIDSDNINECRDYSASQKTVLYCLSSGHLRKFKQNSSLQTSFKKSKISKVILKVVSNMITWSVAEKQTSTEVVSIQFKPQQLQRARILIIFRKGTIQMFPQTE